ncbi:MAG: glutamyl-tRNA reductase, partial [Actinomycetota bacterium]|nr:glutamyl-tRNA reductase [Actinomycetota bacterium]
RALAAELADGCEAVCLSTCNRTELYLAGDDAAALEHRAVRALAALAGADEARLAPVLYRLHGASAALHAFRVAAGLDSMVPGEGEILGQVRAAYEAGRPGPVLDRLFRQALYAGKKVRAETAISESPTSVASAAAALAEQVFGELRGRSVLLIGAGHTGRLTARNLAKRGATIAAVANRAGERADSVARALGARALALEDVTAVLDAVDVVVSSTSAPGVILPADRVAAALPARKGLPLFLIDIAVPRDLDPAIHGLDGCYLYDIDDLESVVAESLAGRREEAVRAEAIVAQEAERFAAWHAARDVVPAIALLRERAEEIRAGELARAETGLERLSDSERRVVESVTAGIVNKLLHLPTVRLKEAAAGADGGAYADAVRHLFGLGEQPEDGERS